MLKPFSEAVELISKMSEQCSMCSRDNFHPYGFGLSDDTFAETLETEARQSWLTLLDLCYLVNVFERDGADCVSPRLLGASEFVLDFLDASSLKK